MATIVSWNIQKGIGMDLRRDISRTAEVLAPLEPDVVGLQEVLRVRDMDQAATIAERVGMALIWGEARRTRDGGYGNALLVRGEVVSSTVHDLTVGRREARCCIDAVVRVRGILLRVVVCHLTRPGRTSAADRPSHQDPAPSGHRSAAGTDGRLQRVAPRPRPARARRGVLVCARPEAIAPLPDADVRARPPGLGRQPRRDPRRAPCPERVGPPAAPRDAPTLIAVTGRLTFYHPMRRERGEAYGDFHDSWYAGPSSAAACAVGSSGF